MVSATVTQQLTSNSKYHRFVDLAGIRDSRASGEIIVNLTLVTDSDLQIKSIEFEFPEPPPGNLLLATLKISSAQRIVFQAERLYDVPDFKQIFKLPETTLEYVLKDSQVILKTSDRPSRYASGWNSPAFPMNRSIPGKTTYPSRQDRRERSRSRLLLRFRHQFTAAAGTSLNRIVFCCHYRKKAKSYRITLRNQLSTTVDAIIIIQYSLSALFQILRNKVDFILPL